MVTETEPDQPHRGTQSERRKEAERRLLDAALRLVAEGGVSAATFARIAEVSGCSRGIITHYFGSKTALLERLTTDLQDQFSAAAAPLLVGVPGLDALLILTERYLQAARGEGLEVRAFAVLWTEAATTTHELRKAIGVRDQIGRAGIRSLVRRGIDDGSIRADINPSRFAALHLPWLRTLVLEHLLDPEGFDLDEILPEVLATIRARLASKSANRT